MDKARHLSDSDLMNLADRPGEDADAGAREEHVLNCVECRKRLQQIEAGLSAYDSYHARVLKRGLEKSVALRWPGMAARVAEMDKREENKFFTPGMWWAMAGVAFCVTVLVVFWRWEPAQPEMRQVLAQAEKAASPVHRRVQFTAGGRSWYRAAVLGTGDGAADAGMEHVEALFVRANYSWKDPLSARSFAAWRKQLHEKRDQLMSIRGDDGRQQFYRLETETNRGVLRTAALTLRVNDFAAVKGAFAFEDKESVTVEDSGEMPRAQPPSEAKQGGAKPGARATAVKASEQDELRVFAALDAIGADAGEPVDVGLDGAKEHVVVTGMGIPEARQREIQAALEGVPNTVTHFEGGRRAAAPDVGSKMEGSPSDASAPLRAAFEERAGGSRALEKITERALEASNTILAHAHALLVLSHKFSPTVEESFATVQRETLRKLRQRHAAAMERGAAELRGELKPLLSLENGAAVPEGTKNGVGASWQEGVAPLFEAARVLDAQVSRLLGGSYAEDWGRETLGQLPNELEKVETLARWQAAAE